MGRTYIEGVEVEVKSKIGGREQVLYIAFIFRNKKIESHDISDNNKASDFIRSRILDTEKKFEAVLRVCCITGSL